MLSHKKQLIAVAIVLSAISIILTSIMVLIAEPKRDDLNKEIEDMDRYFSPDYSTARHRFLSTSRSVGARLSELRLNARGPENETLSIDISWLGIPQPRRVVIHTSGLHGVEGFAGSAIQIKLLETPPVIPDDGAIIFVHALNPYGMAWLRRFNESNVDLNRNFLKSGRSYEGAPEGYRLLNRFLNPMMTPRPDCFYLRTAYYVMRYGFQNLKQAIAGGQYEYPKGLFFGGSQLEQGPALYKEWLKTTLSSVDYILVIDVHTGLGKFCQESLFHKVEATQHTVLSRAIKRHLIREYVDSSTVGYKFQGGHCDVYEELFPRGKVDFITQEFGTLSNLRVLHALQQENQYHHYGERKLDHRTKKKIRQAFYPDSREWKASIIKDGVTLVKGCIDYVFTER